MHKLKEFFIGSVRRQLITGVVLVHALMMTLFIWDLTVRQQTLLMEQQFIQAKALVESVATSSSGWLLTQDFVGIQEIIDAQKRYPDLIFAIATDLDGRILAHTDPQRLGQFIVDLPSTPELTVLNHSPALVDIVNPAIIAGEHIGWIRVGLGQSSSNIQMAKITRDGILYTFGAIFIGIVLASIVGTGLTRRLNTIQSVATAIMLGKLDKRVPEQGIDEAAQLAHQFNEMLDTLHDREQQLISSHQALVESEARFQRILRGASDGMWEWNIKTNELYFSPRWKSMLGYKEEELSSSYDAWKDRLHPDDVKSTLATLNDYLAGKLKKYEVEFRLQHKDGHWVHILARAELERDENGNPLRLSGTHVDVSELKQAEAERQRLHNQLLQSQKMESIGHLTGGIAHDFNNMLSIILGYTNLLQIVNKNRLPVDDKAEKYLDEVTTAGNRAKELINQMLIFSRKSSDIQRHDAPVVLLKPIVKEIVTLLRSSFPTTIELNYEIEDQELKAKISPVHLHQILLNLGINARDSIKEYGQINITLKKRTFNDNCVSCHQDFAGDFLELMVTDNGCGISEEIKNKIFEPFFTTKEVGKGTGMGLAVAHGIVHSIDGHILLPNNKNGTSISILLPAISSDDTSQQLVYSNQNGGINETRISGINIMIIDDEPSVSAMLNELLSCYGASVTTHNHPNEALEIFKHNPQICDLVITDETMPELSGLDLAKSMLDIRPDISIILCTGFSEQVNSEIAHQTGISAFMPKPVEISKLINWIEERKSQFKSKKEN